MPRFKTISTTLLLCISLLTINCAVAQVKDTSMLYYPNGSLKADTSFKINKIQLENWIALEDSFIKSILSHIEYNRILLDNDVSGKIIISFAIDEKGNPNSFIVENGHNQVRIYETKVFSSDVIKAILLIPFQFSPPNKSVAGNRTNRYYLPVSFVLSDLEIKDVTDGWIRYRPKHIISY